MRKFAFLLILLLALGCLFACNGPSSQTPDASEDTEDEVTPGEHKVRFFIDGSYVIQKYNIGDIPTPPAVSDIEEEHYFFRFLGWDKEMSPVTGDEDADCYRAVFESTPRNYTVTFDICGEREELTLAYGATIPYPDVESIEVPEGAKFVGWSSSLSFCQGDQTIYPVYTFLCDADTMRAMYSYHLMAYTSEASDNRGMTFARAAAFLGLAAEEHEHPINGGVRERVVEHLRAVSRGGTEPTFDVGPYWNYPLLAAAIAISKDTPTVWNALTDEEVARLDVIMRAFAVIGCFATDSDNDFRTGVALSGNYKKTWNPNYRLSMVPLLLFAKSYFGSTEAVNQIFADFDYDEYMADFEKFGFTRVYEAWSTETHRVLVGNNTPLYNSSHKRIDTYDGTYLTVPGAKDLFMNGMNGGKVYAYAYDSRYGGDLMMAGSGIGVKGNVYTYDYLRVVNGMNFSVQYSLDDVAGIVYALLDYTYSGGRVQNSWTDGRNNAYIADGTSSIMLGQNGMFKEFNTSNRSSAGYSAHDFSLVVSILYALELLDMYDIQDTSGLPSSLASEKQELWSRVCVGNEDLIYKLIHGYWSYAASSGKTELTNEASRDFGYTVTKAIWCNYFYPDSYGKKTMTGNDAVPEA